MVIEVRDAVHGVNNEKNLVGLLYRELYLLVDFRFEDVFRVDNPAAGVDNREFAAVPVNVAILAVTRRARFHVGYGRAAFCKSVEEGGFPYVGAPHYGYHL